MLQFFVAVIAGYITSYYSPAHKLIVGVSVFLAVIVIPAAIYRLRRYTNNTHSKRP